MKGEIILLDGQFSMFGMRARIALAEKAITYEYREQNLVNKGPLLLKMNPVYKKVPVLIHDGKPVCESLIIVQYIDEVWNDTSPLLPQDPYNRAQARFWADFVDKKVSDPALKICAEKGEELEAVKKQFIDALKLLEGQLGDKKFFGGDVFGFVDVALITFSCWFEAFEFYGSFSIRDHCPKLMTWVDTCMMRENVRKSLADPKKVIDFCNAWRKKVGIDH